MAKGFYVSPTREAYLRAKKKEQDRRRSQERVRNRPFIAWDGEGFNVGLGGDYWHKYMLMVNSEDQILESDDGEGIATDEALQFLLDGATDNPDAIHIMYGMSYDVNMILNGMFRELPYGSLMRLVQEKKCRWLDYDIEYIPRRFFRVSQYETDAADDGHRRHGRLIRSVGVWDVAQFFQCPFVEALEGLFTEQEMYQYFDIEFIRHMKTLRGEFTIEDLRAGRLADYSLAECHALVELMTRFRRNCHESGIHLNRYDGAGAGAAALLRDHGLPDKIKTASGIIHADVNRGLPDAVRIGYGGGRVEMFMYGHTDQPVYWYDMVGSFPSQMPDLPDLSNGIWEHLVFSDALKVDMSTLSKEFAIYKVYWDYRGGDFNRMFPFFYRMPWGAPHIHYPPHGYSWVWAPELAVALSPNAMKHLGVAPRILEVWRFHPYDETCKPFSFVEDVYQKRLEYKRKGMNGQALGIKASLNAIPGKMAQTVGRDIPPYFNLAYAGYITSRVRARLYDAMMQSPYSIIASATDGLWSLIPLDLPIGDQLGEWKYGELDGFTSVQPGVYFTRKKVDGRSVSHYRGFNSGAIKEEDVLKAWLDREYAMKIPTERFVGMGSIMTKRDYKDRWCTWEKDVRILNIHQGLSTKRFPVLYEGEEWPTSRAATSLVETEATWIARFQENVPKYGDTDKWGIPLDTYLSKRYHVPWLAAAWEEKQAAIEREIDWEVIESEL